jgi:hypothetical protein
MSSQRPPLRIRQVPDSGCGLWSVEVRVLRMRWYTASEWYPFAWAPSQVSAVAVAERHWRGCVLCAFNKPHVDIPKGV